MASDDNNVPQSAMPASAADPPTRTWDMFTDRVESFVLRWEDKLEPPPLAEFLPSAPMTIRRLVLVELIKIDLEYRWIRLKQGRTLEHYLADFPELGAGGVPSTLIEQELQVRQRAGDTMVAGEQHRRFPQQGLEIDKHLSAASGPSTLIASSLHLPRIQAGQELDDFTLLALLGKGGFAKVFLAWQKSMHRLVALKVSADYGDEPRTLAQLDHPHIVRVYDQRTLPEQNLRLLYMEYLPGGTMHELLAVSPASGMTGAAFLQALADRLERAAPRGLPADAAQPTPLREQLAALDRPALVCWIGARLAAALDHAHRCGILHRDVKPANILLTADGLPKLADFNVGFSAHETTPAAAFFGGSLAYMSPEQLEAFHPQHPRRPDSLDGRSDLYALAIILWELLTGKKPFPGPSGHGALVKQVEELLLVRRQPLTPSHPDTPLHETLRRALDPDPERRFAAGADFARSLRLLLLPRAQGLLDAHRGWRRLVARTAMTALVVADILPNLLIGVVNLLYNQQEIVAHLSDAGQQTFWRVQAIINSIAFPLGLVVGGCLVWPVAATVAQVAAGVIADRERLAAMRRRCLLLGPIVAGVSLLLWVLAGLAYPLGMYVALGGLSTPAIIHFLASLMFCGLLAATYPFFAVAFLAVRVFYPVLLRPSLDATHGEVGLARLKAFLAVALLLAAAVPMLAITLLVLTGSQNSLALVVLSAGGLVGFAGAFALSREIQLDLEALADAQRVAHETA